MIDGFRRASFANRLAIPITHDLEVVLGVGPVYGANIFPHDTNGFQKRGPFL